MLTPQQILDIIETLYPQIDELNVWITSDLIRRVMARLGRGEGVFLTASDEWQLEVYQAAGGHLDAVQREIKRWTKATDAEIKRIFEDAGIKALAYDSNFYVEHGLAGIELAQSESMIRLLEDTYQRTAGTVHNFTRTTAHASQQQLLKALDTAHFKVASARHRTRRPYRRPSAALLTRKRRSSIPPGTLTPSKPLSCGLFVPASRRRPATWPFRVWRNATGTLCLCRRISAHATATGGQNPGNHFWWQGKFYSRTGRTPDLPLFVESTGYGTGEGLCGWNCRHSFGPGDLRHNPYAQFDAEENKKAFDLSQKQRGKESRIRRTKTKLVGLRTAIEAAEDAGVKATLEAQYTRTAKLLEKQNLDYNQFCEDNGLKRLSDRIQIAKWTREDARKSIAAARSK